MRLPPHLHTDVLAPSAGSLTAMQRRFVDSYVAGHGSPTDAAIEAGYSPTSAKATASRMTRNPMIQKEIMRGVVSRIGLQAVPALHTIERLAQSSRSDYVRLEAARDLLDRAGFRPPERVDHRLDHQLTVELLLAHHPDGEGGSKRSVTQTVTLPDTGKSRPEPDDPGETDGEGGGFVIERGSEVAFPTDPVNFSTSGVVFSTIEPEEPESGGGLA